LGTGLYSMDALITALALAFGIRLVVLMAVSKDSVLRALLPASVQTVAGALILMVYMGLFTLRPYPGPYLQNLLMTSAFYVAGAYLFVRYVDRPVKDGIGVSGTELLRGFIAYISEGTRELEEVFEEMGEEVIVPVVVLSFREKGTTTEKARFVLPMAHPGLIGDIGGGNLPSVLAETSPSLCFVPHATA
ncbi:MAG: DUF2070 family protein, partial [Halobacteria archaeon]|nr:DUF2070 family protein [Halobacteria archaeon]